MAYTTINKSSDYFNTKLYTGTGSSNAQTGVGFQPDLLWIKQRNSAVNHLLHDSIRGVTKLLVSNSSAGEDTNTNILTSFDSDGFTVGTNSASNGSSDTYAAWNWKANGAGSANTDGDINSTVSANTTAGFSIVKYTGTDVAGATVGHGLGAVPKMIILKRLVGNGYDWVVYHAKDTAGLYLNSTGNNNDSSSNNIWFNGTAPTSSVFSIGTDGRIGDATDFIAYCFAEKTGYSKFGSYTGNGNADGAFVYTGFKPAFVITKLTSAYGEGWILQDNKRSTYNPSDVFLSPSSANADSITTNAHLDFLSNGFKLRHLDNRSNGSGMSYIYMAFAEAPLVGTNNVPCTAR